MLLALAIGWFSSAEPTTGSQASEVDTFTGYPDAPPFEVVPRKDQLAFYPCAQCHQFIPPNPTPRELSVPPAHPSVLQHGEGRMWCMVCHQVEDRNYLRTLRDEKVGFDQAHLICGQCHANRQRDWYFGGHGKRVQHWKGGRRLYLCTHCHNAHDPTLEPREPRRPPPVREGLEPMPVPHIHREKVWERLATDAKEVPHEP